MADIESRMVKLRAQLSRLEKIKRSRAARRAKPKSENPVGRPRVSPQKIAEARELAAEAYIPDVAMVTGIPLSTLYDHGIKRYIIPLKTRPTKS